jgi:ubiquitin-like 1-activating enzyme E1 B
LPKPTKRPKPPPPAPETPKKANGRLLPIERDDGVIDLAPTPRKPRYETEVEAGKKRKAEDQTSPSKKRRLEEDGFVVLDAADEKVDDGPDVIMID